MEENIILSDGKVIIFPLLASELELLALSTQQFSSYINLFYDFDAPKNKYIKNCLKNIQKNQTNWFFYTIWVIVKIDEQKIIGNIFINSKKQIKYEINKNYFNQGLCTRAVTLMCDFAKQKQIKNIFAKTNIQNSSAQNVLEKNKFKKYNKKDENYYYKKEII